MVLLLVQLINCVRLCSPMDYSTPHFPVLPYHLEFAQFIFIWGFPGDASSKEPACQCRRHEMQVRSRKIPWRREWKPTPGFLPGECKAWGLQSRQSCLTLCNLAHRHMSIASVILPNHPILCHPLLFISNGPMVKSLLSGAHKMTLPSVAWAEVCTQEIDLFATELSLRC